MNTIEVGEYTFKVEIIRDEHMGAPWEEHDGHGIVSDWTRRAKSPGERVLCRDHNSYRYYDVAETMKLARQDGWGPGQNALDNLTKRLGRAPTKGEIVAAAVDADFHHLRRWCDNSWEWVGVVVTLLDDEGDETNETDSLWGIESDADTYLDEVARELADGIAARVQEENAECDHWAARGAVTL